MQKNPTTPGPAEPVRLSRWGKPPSNRADMVKLLSSLEGHARDLSEHASHTEWSLKSLNVSVTVEGPIDPVRGDLGKTDEPQTYALDVLEAWRRMEHEARWVADLLAELAEHRDAIGIRLEIEGAA